MKSVIGMIVVFIGLYIVIYSGVFDFFAQKWFFNLAVGSVFLMLIIAFFTLGVPHKSKGGGHDDKNNHLD